jgi:peptide deformylase
MIDMKLIPENSSMLLKPSMEFNFLNPPFDPKEFAESLYNTMARYDGLGLSAVQVGYPYRVFAMRNDKDPIVLFNPRIVFHSSTILSMKEGCLSFPLLFLNVKRPDSIRVRYQTWENIIDTSTFIGMSARIALHEYDHLDGKLFTQVASSFEVEQSKRKRMILQRKVKRAKK